MAAEEDFPGLNKRHGFFRAIERNQRDRDDYHHKMERKKQARQNEVRKERKPRQTPTAEVYRPPGSRQLEERSNHQDNTEGVYCIEIEVGPGKWHQQVIKQVGKGFEVAQLISRQYRLDRAREQAISELLAEFEAKLSV